MWASACAPSPGSNHPSMAGKISIGRTIRILAGGGWRIATFPISISCRHVAASNQFASRRDLELSLLHLGLWGLGWLARLGLPLDLPRHAGTLLKVSNLFNRFGSADGGMHMILRGRGHDGAPHERRWFIVAKNGDGPQIPCVPAILHRAGLGSRRGDGARRLPLRRAHQPRGLRAPTQRLSHCDAVVVTAAPIARAGGFGFLIKPLAILTGSALFLGRIFRRIPDHAWAGTIHLGTRIASPRHQLR